MWVSLGGDIAVVESLPNARSEVVVVGVSSSQAIGPARLPVPSFAARSALPLLRDANVCLLERRIDAKTLRFEDEPIENPEEDHQYPRGSLHPTLAPDSEKEEWERQIAEEGGQAYTLMGAE
ncbi:hypothetical protein BDZ91DRAFT_848643 [Kalaharituber pfeilii]|nr:hypothetical protein BDZ91DRAFT_848643 [Kalaharituber pfeilii]